jgi:RNA polymerase sigma factor (sigma-70 family)
MATANRPYGKINKGHTIPYGTLAGVSQELKSAYYTHGYQHDEDMPELPCPPQEDEECVDLEEEVYKKDVVRLIEEALDDVTPRQKKVLCLRFGIGVTQEYTLEEIGAVFGVTRECIRQIEAKAIRRIKHPDRSDKLKDLVGQYVTTAEKKAAIEAKQTQWEKERAEVEKSRQAAVAKINKSRKKWIEIKPMISDVSWVEHLKTENPEMYQELKYLVGDIWGKSAKEIWDIYTTGRDR